MQRLAVLVDAIVTASVALDFLMVLLFLLWRYLLI